MSSDNPVDENPDLATLLAAVPRARLEASLAGTLGPLWALTDHRGALLYGTEGAGPARAGVTFECEVLGHVHGAEEGVRAAAAWLELVLGAAWRYRMAARLHETTATADYVALKKSHAALATSEARYKALAASLEVKVAEQVEAIGRSQRQLYAGAHLAAVGSLAAGMAHEINNPLGFIRSNLQTAQQYLEQLGAIADAWDSGDAAGARALAQRYDLPFLRSDFATLLDESLDGAARVARIVEHLKTFAGTESAAREAADLNTLVRSATDLLGDQLPGTVRLEVALAPLPLVTCVPNGIKQAVFALADNARRALPGGGTIAVRTALQGDHVQIEVQDDGIGMSEAVRARACEPFFSTRDVGQGTGLGLTLARDIVQAHGGQLALESAPGTGTRVTLSLPLAAAQEMPQ